MAEMQRISPCLWFDDQAEAAAKFYTDIFDDSRIVSVTRYSEAGFDVHRKAAGSVMTVDFELAGQSFTALNGGPGFELNEAVSFQILCDDQQEIDYYWDRLTAGGDPKAQQCGWLKDRFGLSWQVVPRGMAAMLEDSGSPEARRAMEAILRMKKIDIEELHRAYQDAA